MVIFRKSPRFFGDGRNIRYAPAKPDTMGWTRAGGPALARLARP